MAFKRTASDVHIADYQSYSRVVRQLEEMFFDRIHTEAVAYGKDSYSVTLNCIGV